jgi:hypothetical protein
MRRTHTPLGRLGATALTVAVVASLAGIGAASAADSGTVTVTGASSAKIELTVPDGTAQFGTDLTPDGNDSNGDASVVALVDTADPSAGACYRWPGSVVVRSNVGYYVTVAGSGPNARLDFLQAQPTTYAQCNTGEQVAVSMFGSATPAHSWVAGETKTGKRTHPFWLGLDVQWEDDPGTIADQTLTLTATATP